MIEIISGTNRPGSNALRIAKLVQSLYHRHGAQAQILDLQGMPAEAFLPGSYAEKPAAFLAMQDRVLRAKGLHVIVPEYNGSFPGVLKYFIDLLKFPESFEHRCVAYVGEAAGIWGGLRAVEQLQMVFAYRNAYALPERVFIPAVHQALDGDGKLTNELQADLLDRQVQAFIKFTGALAG
jgi:NAD(P)H-dependent FMN reductase